MAPTPFPIALLAGLLFCLLALALLERSAHAVGLLDTPTQHKAHTHPTPAVGGIGMALTLLLSGVWVLCSAGVPAAGGFFGAANATLFPATGVGAGGGGSAAGAAYAGAYSLPGACALYFGILSLAVLGAVDDVRHLRAHTKLGVMLAIFAATLFYSGNLIYQVGELWPGRPVGTSLLAIPLTLFAAVGVVNAFNLIDGMDGLAGSVAACILAGFVLLAFMIGATEWLPFLGVCLGAVLAFLAYNLRLPGRPRARLFMGDAGSLVLGFILFWLAVALAHRPQGAVPPVVMVWLLAFPMLDTVATMALRIREGKSILAPGHDHFHHLMLRVGWSVNGIVALAAGLTVGLAAVGIGLWRLGVPDWASLLLFLAVTAGYVRKFLRSWRKGDRRGVAV